MRVRVGVRVKFRVRKSVRQSNEFSRNAGKVTNVGHVIHHDALYDIYDITFIKYIFGI
jgi:hypothetical protein